MMKDCALWSVKGVGRLAGLVGLLLLICAGPAICGAASAPVTPAPSGFVAVLTIDAPIGPPTAEYYRRTSKRAIADGARAIVLKINTPGGLSSSMHKIIADILASPVPVLGYVAPGGARAASAGTYILYACHIAAMAPATHLGAATPVSLSGKTPMPAPPASRHSKKGTAKGKANAQSKSKTESSGGGAEQHKILNDAIAYIRSLAQLRHRNAAWAEAAVRGAATLTASEAVAKHVADFVAPDVRSVLKQADGRTVKVGQTTQTLHLKGLSIRDYPSGWRTRFLVIISNPTIAYILLLVGIYGLVLEAFHPGIMFPGVIGAISLLIGAYALQLLPVDYSGLLLMVLGIGMVIGEALMPTMGALGIGGVVAFVVGSIMLMQTGVPGYEMNLGVVFGLATVASVLLLIILYVVMRSRRRQPVVGDDDMAGLPGEVVELGVRPEEGWAVVRGERWRVHARAALSKGMRIRVVSRQGLLLYVEGIDTPR